ncbi:MAG TPA: hypothetical protein VML54_02675 [Candidatus Limnocylindrales bacterium]|nr:hypothetical protein [Candidatus Limnocylindrales bacterium]
MSRPPLARRGALVLLALALAVHAIAAPASTQPAFPAVAPGTWVELPNTRLDSVLWRDRAGKTLSSLKGSNSPASIITAWNGAAYDDKRDLLIILAAGGDNDYPGNEVYTFDLLAQKWRRDFDPTVELIPYLQRHGPQASDEKVTKAPPSVYRDGNNAYPVSRHTYNGLTYMPTVDKTWVAGGSRWWAGGGINDIFFWDHAERRWEHQARDVLPTWFLGITSAWDSVKNRVLYHDEGRLRAFNPAAAPGSRQAALSEDRHPNESTLRFYTSLFDPERRRFVMAGPKGVIYYDFAADREGSLKRRTMPLTGTAWPAFYAPGFVYDPVGKRYAAYSGRNTLYFINPDTGEVTVETGGGAPTTAAPGNGTFGRFRFSRSQGVFVVVNAIDENVRVYRPLPARQ